MKYKVGETVVIRTDIYAGRSYDSCNFVDHMEKYRGMPAIIKSARRTVRGDRYRIDVDDNVWSWSNSMFECFAEEELDTSDFDLMNILKGG